MPTEVGGLTSDFVAERPAESATRPTLVTTVARLIASGARVLQLLDAPSSGSPSTRTFVHAVYAACIEKVGVDGESRQSSSIGVCEVHKRK